MVVENDGFGNPVVDLTYQDSSVKDIDLSNDGVDDGVLNNEK